MKKYAIVKFLRENGALYVVPKLWIHRGNCFWPQTKSSSVLEALVKSNANKKEDWKQFPVEIIGQAKTYERAEEKLQEYLANSELEMFSTDAEETPKRPRVNNVIFPKNVPCDCQHDVLIKDILKTVRGLDERVEAMYEIVRKIQPVGEVSVPAEVQQLKTYEDLMVLEAKLIDEEEFSEMVRSLGLQGGINEVEATRRILSKLISHELAVKLIWTGSKMKHSFKDLPNIIQLIAVSVRQNHAFKSAAMSIIEETIKRWLRNAADREGGRVRRMKLGLNMCPQYNE